MEPPPQGGILSPCLFSGYIYDLILLTVSRQKVGCNIGGVYVNVFAYADDIVLLAPSWHVLQTLLSVLEHSILTIDISCNTRKTVCMVFRPRQKWKILSNAFPTFRLFWELICSTLIVLNILDLLLTTNSRMILIYNAKYVTYLLVRTF